MDIREALKDFLLPDGKTIHIPEGVIIRFEWDESIPQADRAKYLPTRITIHTPEPSH